MPDTGPVAPLAYYWGEDAFGLERAAQRWAESISAQAGERLDQWRVTAGEETDGTAAGEGAARRRARLLDELEQRLATAPMFGGGTLVVLRQPGLLLRESTARNRAVRLPALVAPGNGLCVIDLVASGGKAAAGSGALLDAVGAAGGQVKQLRALSREGMESWLVERAAELGARLEPAAARLLAERVGAWVREADVDRRRQSELANGELEKLALYRPGGIITREDVEALVTEAVPGSAWAFLDAVGSRRVGEAARLAERLLDGGLPLQLLVAQLHRRLRELVVVRDHIASGTRPAELPQVLKLQPFRAKKLAEQARAWEQDQLDRALRELLELDLLSKGIADDGSPRSLSDGSSRLFLLSWLGSSISRFGATAAVR